MQIGMIGLGRMGANMARRLARDGHSVVGYDPIAAAVKALAPQGVEPARSLPRLVDGGNSNHKGNMRRATALSQKGAHMLDCGTSGGVWGCLEEGCCLMVGGDRQAYERIVSPATKRVTGMWGRAARAISARWSATASSTRSCRPTRRASS